jgi:hypothetical protein
MPVNLNQLLTLAGATAAEQAMLDNLQASSGRMSVTTCRSSF